MPPRPPQAFLALSFMSEGLLLVFHLKGPRVEVLVHLILVLQVFATGGQGGRERGEGGERDADRVPSSHASHGLRRPVPPCTLLAGYASHMCLRTCSLRTCSLPRAPSPVVVAICVELAAPSSILAASARPWLTMLQGAW